MSGQATVLALGFFDGIHLGHGALLERAKERAAAAGAVPAVLTFDTHPDLFVKGAPVELLCSGTDRNYILRRFFDLERVYYLHFNDETMRMDWREFLERVVRTYGAVHFVVGYDFRFGYQGAGTGEGLADWCAARGLGCDIVPPVTMDGAPVSSTRIRRVLREGALGEANTLLGHPHLLTDLVRSGFRLGRTMDYPTINMRFEEGVLVPAHGVYAAKVVLPEGGMPAMTNIGVRPTFGGARVTVESHIFDYSADLYGQRLCVELHAYLRPERRFSGPEELQAQLERDAEQARAFFDGFDE